MVLSIFLHLCNPMNYSETLVFLMERLPMFSRIGAAAYKPSLSNTLTLCEALGNPERSFRTIHVAGTNGKGSVSHMLAAILQEAGYKTGLYTSPHLRDFRERIRINGIPCPESFVIDFTASGYPLIESVQPSFFEITVAMAFQYFADNKVDIAVIETGLGGRLDSTNVIQPDLSVITSIGLDHMNILGNTREAIAVEKAGIIKTNTPVVLGHMDASLYSIFDEITHRVSGDGARQLIHHADKEWRVLECKPGDLLTILIREENNDAKEFLFELDLPGRYQQHNLPTVLSSVRVLQQLQYDISFEQAKNAVRKVVSTTGLHGRWETINKYPRIVLEVAHNEDGIRQVVQQLEKTPYNRLFIIIGMVKDKEINTVLCQLPLAATYYFSQASLPRALPAKELMQMASVYGLKGEAIPGVNDAIQKALSQATENDLILICGSIFLVGEVDVKRFGTVQ